MYMLNISKHGDSTESKIVISRTSRDIKKDEAFSNRRRKHVPKRPHPKEISSRSSVF